MKAYEAATAVTDLSDKKKVKLLRDLEKCMTGPTGDTTTFSGNLAYCAEKFGSLAAPRDAALYEYLVSYDGAEVLVCPVGYNLVDDIEGVDLELQCVEDANSYASYDPLGALDWNRMELLY